jgi:rod shape determining protein RodA
VVGIPLPLVSWGGSSLIAMMAAMGVMISINTRRYLF